jgi:hypothetical protein
MVAGLGGLDTLSSGAQTRGQRGRVLVTRSGQGGAGAPGVDPGVGGAAGVGDVDGDPIEQDDSSFKPGAPGAACPTLTFGGVGDGGTVTVDGQPPGQTMSFVGTGLTPGAAVQITGTSDHGDSYGPLPGTVRADGTVTVTAQFWSARTRS